jgi:hypothetical protein
VASESGTIEAAELPPMFVWFETFETVVIVVTVVTAVTVSTVVMDAIAETIAARIVPLLRFTRTASGDRALMI